MEKFLRKREPEDLLEACNLPHLYGRCIIYAENGRTNRLIGAALFVSAFPR